MNNQGVLTAEVEQNLTHLAQKGAVGYAQYLVASVSGICQRSKDIENCPDANLTTRWSDMFHGRVIGRGKHKAKPNLLDTTGHLLRAKINACTESLQHVGTSAEARGGTVTMFCYRGPGCGSKDTSCC